MRSGYEELELGEKSPESLGIRAVGLLFHSITCWKLGFWKNAKKST